MGARDDDAVERGAARPEAQGLAGAAQSAPAPTLAELQSRFAATLRAADDADPDARLVDAIRDDGIAVAQRLAVYRRNLRGNFLKVLALEFPVIERLGGADWFRQAGLAFLDAHPSQSGDLHHVGAPFAGFLARRLRGTPHEYFADVAALEWAWQECLVAADAERSLDVAALAGVDGERAAGLRFTPHPALRLVESRWPVFTIWMAQREVAGAADAPSLDLDAGGEAVLLRRSGAGAEARRIDAAYCAWLRALAAGAPLGAAWDAAAAVEPGFDVARALATAVAHDLFCGFEAR